MFHGKDGFDVGGPAQPAVNTTVTYANGTVVSQEVSEDAGTVVNAATDRTDAKIRAPYLRAIGGAYEVAVSGGGISFPAVMADNEENLTVERAGTSQHPITGKFVDNQLN